MQKNFCTPALTRLRKGAYNTDCLISVVCTDSQFADYGKTWEKEIAWKHLDSSNNFFQEFIFNLLNINSCFSQSL